MKNMQSPFSMSPQAMSALLDWVNDQNEGVFWIKSLDGKQLYVGEEFEQIWNRPCKLLYEEPKTWYDSLIHEDHQTISDQMNTRKASPNALIHELLFRIHVPGNKIKYLRDIAIKLYDQNGNFCALAGIGQHLDVNVWDKLYQSYLNKQKNAESNPNALKLENILNSVLKKEFALTEQQHQAPPSDDYYIVVNNKPLHLSRREFQCLFYLASGKSAKQTGALLFLSQRTVETYLDSLKQKLLCRTKLEILSKIDINHLMEQFSRFSHIGSI